MKKTNTKLSLSTLALLLAGFLFTSANVAIAAEEKAAEETKEVAAETDAKKEGAEHADMKKKKKKGKDGEEPECE